LNSGVELGLHHIMHATCPGKYFGIVYFKATKEKEWKR
jgi:hypothetical protein